jgi:hypothetical protein
MTIIPQLQSPTSRAIDLAYERGQVPTDHHPTLRCSSLGHPCDRKLWYALRWAHDPERFDGRMLRIFENGHQREAVIVAMLRSAGLTVEDRDPRTGEQFRVVLADGHLSGSCDGVVTGVPDAPKTPHLLEIKTMNDARWKAWRKVGVKASDPKYWTQMQLYMHGLGLTRALFVAENQNTRELEVERVEFDRGSAMALEARAERIATADRLPARISDNPDWHECRRCPAHGLCHGQMLARRNCRTCMAYEIDGRCGRFDSKLKLADQIKGCDHHLFGPVLVPGEVVHVSDATISYQMRDGSLFVDGMREDDQP